MNKKGFDVSVPLFSIVIATYNAEKTIRRCLVSLLNQQTEDLEIRIVDGGSSDSTLQRIMEFTSLPITVTSKPDNGLYDALNTGIRTTSGHWINILGADDELLPGSLDTVKKTIEQYPADIYAGFSRMAGKGSDSLLRVDRCALCTLASHIPFCHNAMFASRHSYEVVGLYDLSYRVSADAQWIHRAIRAGMRFQTIEMPLVRFYSGGISGNPELTMPECYRLIQENFPCLTEAEAKSLLFISKGWEDGSGLEEILARHPEEKELARAARAARDYAPYCAQRRLEQEIQQQTPLWKKLGRRLVRFCK